MIDLQLFANGRFLAASVVTFIIGAGLYGSTYLLPLFMQTIVGLKATDSGFLMLPARPHNDDLFPPCGSPFGPNVCPDPDLLWHRGLWDLGCAYGAN